MAFTINRNNEISEDRLNGLKQKFKTAYNTVAIYRMAEDHEFLEAEVKRLRSENEHLKQIAETSEEIMNLQNQLKLKFKSNGNNSKTKDS